MADLAITASAVIGTTSVTKTAGVAFTAGKVAYIDTADGKAKLSDSNVVAAAKIEGIALNAAEISQPVSLHKSGPLTMDAVLTAGVFYYLSPTAGGICPVADVGSGHRVISVGYATSTTVLFVQIVDTGIVKA